MDDDNLQGLRKKLAHRNEPETNCLKKFLKRLPTFRNILSERNIRRDTGILSPERQYAVEDGMPEQGLKELYIDELKDLFNAENQLVKALPKMAKAASSEKLRSGFEEHLEQTKGHVQRLEKIFESLGESPKGKTCNGMKGLIEEGSEMIDEDYDGNIKDAGLIGAAQRVEHYEIAGYGTARAMAETLGETEHASLLEETLEEEKATDEKLTELAEQINAEANGGESEFEDEKKVNSSDKKAPKKIA